MTIRLFLPGRPNVPAVAGREGALALHEASAIRAAAVHARRVLPGPVGELVAREFNAYAEFGVRFTTDAFLPRLVAHVLAMPSPVVADEGSRPADRSGPGP
ncbi:MAG: hypothetical protein L0H84_24325, partial [Pseudonocardia sp.]|nr:hypothetical protein [Pseudonocardia sp.]